MNIHSSNIKSVVHHSMIRFHFKNIAAVLAISVGAFMLTLLLLVRLESLNQMTQIQEIPTELTRLPPMAYNLQVPAPQVTAKNIYVFDPVALSVLYEKQSEVLVPPASTTKLMTALIALHSFELSDVIALPATRLVVGSSSKIASTATWSVEQLLHALLVSSGNDAAIALAQAHPQGYDGFVSAMNQAANDLNLHQTHFNNVSGLDSPGHVSSARDLAFLALEVMRHPLLREIVAAPSVSIQDTTGQITATLYSTNELLGREPGVIGVKTGKTEAALECLVTWVERDNHPVVLVVLGSTDRFGDTQKLLEWIYTNFEWIQV